MVSEIPPVVTAADIPIGMNIRGWEFMLFTNGLRPATNGDVPKMYVNGLAFLGYSNDVAIMVNITGLTTTQPTTQVYLGGVNTGWEEDVDGYIIRIKDDRDYIVNINNLPRGSKTVWGFENIIKVG